MVRGIAQQIIDRLAQVGGTSGHAEMSQGYDYDSVCTAIDTELYKLVTFEMLDEAGVFVCVNTLLTGAVREGARVKGVIAESRSGREAFYANSFVDCTAYGDLAAFAGAEYTEPNDYAVANSIGVGNVNVEKYGEFLRSHDALTGSTLTVDQTSGETHRRHHVSTDGFYRGKKVVDTGSED